MRTLLYIALVACACAAYANATSEPREWGYDFIRSAPLYGVWQEYLGRPLIYRSSGANEQPPRVERSVSEALRSGRSGAYRHAAPQDWFKYLRYAAPEAWGDNAIRNADEQPARVERSASPAAPLRSRQYQNYYGRSAPQYGGYYGGIPGYPMNYRSSDDYEQPAHVKRSASVGGTGGYIGGDYKRFAPYDPDFPTGAWDDK